MNDEIPDELADRIRTYYDTHPDAGAVELLGRFDLPPDRLDAVAALLEADAGEHEPITDPNRNEGDDESKNLSQSKSRKTNTADGDGAVDHDAGGSDLDGRDKPFNSHIYSTTEDDERDETAEKTPPEGDSPGSNPWFDADFTAPESGVYPPELDELKKWMGAVGKQAFAPWGDRDHPEAEPEKDARWKWGLEENHADGPTVDKWLEHDPRLTGRAFIQTEDDRYAFVDGDDVRCPETGEVHPAFLAILSHLGPAPADISLSGAGVHAHYKGELPIDGKGQATFEIDTEPWGTNDSPPTVEIYANTHLAITNGEHVPGTPLEIREWDETALRAILEANGYQDKTEISHDTDRDRSELEEYDPDATTADEKAEDVRDILKAVDRIEPYDLPLRTRRTGEDSTGWDTYDPSYRTSESGESLHYNREGAFHDHKEGEAFGVLSLFAAEEGILSKPWDRLEGADWWDAVDAARDAGAPIPEFDRAGGEDVTHTAVLPPAVRDLTTTASGWDWRHTAEQGGQSLSIDDARERTTDAIADAYERGYRVLVEALPTMGKSYGSIKAAAETGEQITVLTGRGHKEQYAQFREWCNEFGLSHYTLPSFTRDCDTANGEHGEEWADTVRGWYNRGATPKEIHKAAEYILGRPLPCQEHEGGRCPYASMWEFDPDDYDVLIGHYKHGHKSKVTAGRAVVFDEFPGDDLETTLGPELQGAVSYWLETTGGIPFESYTDLLENRDDESRRADALLWFDEYGIEPDETHVFDDANAHADAPLAVFSLLASEDLENGFEKADLENIGLGVFDRALGSVSVLRPPALQYASGVVALDGTPTKRMWEIALGERLNHRPVLQEGEKAEYIRDGLNLNLVRTTEYVKPYNSSDHVNTKQDAALLEAIADAHGALPSVITTTTAEHEYDAEGVLEFVDETKHYGNVLGSNEFDDTRLGAVIGSNHYGDDYIQKWGAYAGETVERNDEKGAELSYGGFGDRVLTHMREHDTLQAAMRFGRDGNGAVVYVHTNTLPEWVPLAGEARVLKTWSDGMRDVLEVLEERGQATTAVIVDHPQIELSRQQVFAHLESLRDRGVLEREQDTEDGRRVVWIDDGLHRVNEYGEVDLEAVDLEELDESEVRQVARSSTYTWEFTNFDDTTDDAPLPKGSNGGENRSDAVAGGSDPPDSVD